MTIKQPRVVFLFSEFGCFSWWEALWVGPCAGHPPPASVVMGQEGGFAVLWIYFALNLGVTRPSTCSDSCWGGHQVSFEAGPGRPSLFAGAGPGPGLVGSVPVGGNRRGVGETGGF